jgi:hypothetical protein
MTSWARLFARLHEVVVDWDKYYPPVIEGGFRYPVGREG